jgi:hypothetical protein
MKDREQLAGVVFDDTVIDIGPSLELDDAVRARISSRIRGLLGGSAALFGGFARAADLTSTCARGRQIRGLSCSPPYGERQTHRPGRDTPRRVG